MYTISAIPALQDNYIWAIHSGQHAVVVDPGEAAPVFDFLQQQHMQLDGILCTHRHHDHIGGIAELRGVYNVPVYGREHPKNPHITHPLREGDTLKLEQPDISFKIWELPGHLEDHIAFLTDSAVFCGDILFGGGCGKNSEGTIAQLHASLQRLAALPDSTLVYCAHEYTDYNLPFALACEPDNLAIRQRITETAHLLRAGQATVPFSIATEKATNPFLRCQQTALHHTLRQRGQTDFSEVAVFDALRRWRGRF
ncbi:MAG: hydroxyacylglutathione hydrolase [Gallionella sp.]|nr:hydroxyacylglutathione hydrolase [Gallionella sp.]